MGRPRTKHFDLPPRMRRKGRSYYHVAGNRWTPLGTDKGKALLAWAELEQETPDASICAFDVIAERFRRDVLPKLAPKTAREYARSLDALKAVFGAMMIDQIKPKHVRHYLTARSAPIAANRDVAVLSTLFNRAREWGYTDAANPCAGVRRNEEEGRSVYVTDEEYAAIYAQADAMLRDALAIAYYTAQRPSDVISMKRADVHDGAIWLRQGKTNHPLRIELVGPLQATVHAIFARPVASLWLLADERGQRVPYRLLNDRFVAARKRAGLPHIQFRDLRAKAGTDLEDLAAAQRLLGHSSREMTEHYIKRRAGDRVIPVRRKIRDR